MRRTLLLLPAFSALATAQSLIGDVNQLGPNPSGSPTGGVRAGSLAYYVADDGVHGRELWRTDGTAAGTFLLRDIAPGAASSGADNLTPVGGVLFFTANDPATGVEIWKTDGTVAGTVLVVDLEPGTAGSNPLSLTAVGAQLWFTATYGDAVTGRGRELYRTDGTAAGTVLVADVRPGPLGGLGSDATLAVLGGSVVFPATDGVNGRELWISNGTAAGTSLLADIHPTASSNPGSLVAVGSRVYFTANDGTSGVELWRTDGTFATTARVTDLLPGSGGSAPAALTALGGLVVFSADDGSGGREPFRSDGTAAGTFRLADLNSGVGGSAVAKFVVSGGQAWCLGTNAFGQSVLTRTDGTVAGTVVVISTYSALHDLTAAGTGVAFGANLDAAQDEPWAAAVGFAPARLCDVNPGGVPSNPLGFVALGGTLCFAAFRQDIGFELFACPLGGGSDFLLADVSPQRTSATSDPQSAVLFQGRVWFAADDGVHGRELWTADGTDGPATLFADLQPGAGGSNPMRLVSTGDQLWFVADDGLHGPELWVSDGTPSGTAMVADLNASGGSYPVDLTPVNGQLVFRALDNANYLSNLYVTDGSAAGTQRIYDFANQNGFAMGPFVASGPRVFFPANLPTLGFELWVTDGTTAGTHVVRDIGPGSVNGWPQIVFDGAMVAWNGGVLFNAETAADAIELWFSDGTVAGTNQVASIAPGNSSGFNGQLTLCGPYAYFYGYDAYGGAGYGSALWRTDGTAAGTQLVPGQPYNCQPSNLAALGNVLLFECYENTTGRELWRTDGTLAGTFRVSDVGPALLSGNFGRPVRVGGSGVAVFAAGSVATDRELWRTDGTVAGTWQVTNLNPTAGAGSNPDNLVTDGVSLFVVADDGQRGREPWRVPLALLGAAGAETVGFACPGTAGRRPHIGANGLPQLGNAQFAIQVSNAAPFAAAILLLNLGATVDQPLGGGCTEYVALPAVSNLVLTNGVGAGSYGFAMPNVPAFSGLPIVGQYWVLDPAGAYQGAAALTEGLRLVLGQ